MPLDLSPEEFEARVTAALRSKKKTRYLLHDIGACFGGVKYANTQPGLRATLRHCPHVNYLTWWLAKVWHLQMRGLGSFERDRLNSFLDGARAMLPKSERWTDAGEARVADALRSRYDLITGTRKG